MEKVIITGATGFLGGNFVRHLLHKCVQVTAVVRDADRLADIIKNDFLMVVEADFSSYATLNEIIPQDSYDTFYHFAWEGTSGTGREDYALQIANIKAACEAVAAAKKLGCKRFVNAGSLMEYENMKLMMHAGSCPAGNYLYRSAKLAAHYMAKAEAGRLGISFLNMIISNIYGKGEVSQRLVSATLQKLIKGEAVLFTAGTQLYDFINIKDAVEAFYMVGECGKAFHDYYIGSNRVQPLAEYIKEMYAALPLDKMPEFGAMSYDGISLTYEEFDKAALSRDTGFECRVPFAEGIREAYEWMRRYMDAEV